MDYLKHNRDAWNTGTLSKGVWAQPVDKKIIQRARAGMWEVLLTPKTPVPKEWLRNISGKDILCLASGGGQQAPIFAATGAKVVSFDLSDEQLQKDHLVAERESLSIRCVQGDMADLSCFAKESFDLIFHPASNLFIPDVTPVWKECYRILRPGGALLAGFMNPAVFMFDHDEAELTKQLIVKHPLPYSDEANLNPLKLQTKLNGREPLEFSHSLTAQMGGQTDAGFVITGLYEDHWFDETWLYSRFAPVGIATKATKLAVGPRLIPV
jgi:SAM-dependent methyltransferase